MEKSVKLLTYFKRIGFSLVVLLSLSFTANTQIGAYEAVDEYRNLVFVLHLNKDNTYVFQEKYLDGSIWEDEGEWQQKGEKLKLTSFRKTKREHNYLKFSKTYKFKGDEFLIVGDTLKYGGQGNQKLNDYFKRLLIIKAMAIHDLASPEN